MSSAQFSAVLTATTLLDLALLVAHLQAIEARETARGRADRIAWLNTAPPEVSELAEFNRLRAAVYSLRPKGSPALEQLVALAQGGAPSTPGRLRRGRRPSARAQRRRRRRARLAQALLPRRKTCGV